MSRVISDGLKISNDFEINHFEFWVEFNMEGFPVEARNIVTGVNYDELKRWIESISDEDDEVCMPIEFNNESPVNGLTIKNFKEIFKNLSKLKMAKIPSSIVLMYVIEQIHKQYGRKRIQEFDHLILERVL